jgi:ubiquinone/menaquinone biosynthesis C-methylase UbiE
MDTGAALARVTGLLDPGRITSTVDISRGYLDLLGDRPPSRRSVALAAMRSRVLPLIYERWWRPALRLVNRIDHAGERRLAAGLLGIHSGQMVLDVACGPGNFTRSFAPAVGADGLVVGFDESATMLARAVERADERIGYIRGDARDLPFPDGTFHAVGCFLALHLVPEPFRAVEEMIRVLAPGGRIAISAPYLPRGVMPRVADRVVNAPVGMRMFRRREFTDAFARAGLVDISQRVSGLYQFVGAARPA